MKYILALKLQFLARLILKKYQPRIIAITGSVGKTSVKDAIFAVVSKQISAWRSPANYNNELGVPLAIIGARSGGRSVFAWLGVFLRALRIIFFPFSYPKILVLEMGADHPGDIQKLALLAVPEMSVVTAVSSAHTEFFGDIKRVAEEKGRIIDALPRIGVAILNRDDDLAYAMAARSKGRVVTYGFRDGSDVQAREMKMRSGGPYSLGGVSFTLRHQGNSLTVFLPGVAGRQHVFAALAAAAAGFSFGMTLAAVVEGLGAYTPPAGRMRLLPGIKNTILIDDTYNASPRAALEALLALKSLADARGGARRIAVLGDMLELGGETENAHREVGARAAESADMLIGVGEASRFLCEEAQKCGMSKSTVAHFHTAAEAGHWLQDEVRSGDVVLVKGSQGVRMERIVKEVMGEPLRAKELLVRQSDEWQG
ncbi:MAG: Mur ligase family protein [Patescibacteria group bacterium]